MFNPAEIAASIHEQNVAAGWWDGYDPKSNRFPTATMLVITELAEAVEHDRKDRMDDHLPHHPGRAVELADAAIRLFDLAVPAGLSLGTGKQFNDAVEFTSFRYTTFAENVLEICRSLTRYQPGYSQAIHLSLILIFALAKKHGYDLPLIIDEKREYNANRADHKRENREKVGGKKF